MISLLIILCGLLLVVAPIENTFKLGGMIALIIVVVLLGAFGVAPFTVR